MGIETVGVAISHLHALTLAESKVLVYMAYTVLDKPNAKGNQPYLYYRGEEPLLSVVYGARDDKKYTTSEVRHIRRTLASLRKKGLIEPLGHARTGTRQTWLQKYVFLGTEGGTTGHPQGGTTGHPVAPSRVVQEVTPRKTNPEDTFSGHTSTSQPSPKTARDKSGAKDEGVSERWKDERCDHGHLVRNDTCAPCAEERHDLKAAMPRPMLSLIKGETA